MNLATIKHRLASDFQLAVITLLGMIALLGITPFLVLRAANEQWAAFGVDLIVQGGILASVLYGWASGNVKGASAFLAYFIGGMGLVAIYTLGVPGQYWLYPATVANFFLTDRRRAMAIALLGLGILLASNGLGYPTTDTASFLTTVIVCGLLSYAFAYRAAVQRQQLEELATRDALTGLSNRRALFDEMERAQRTLNRSGRPCGLLLLDIDHFKQLNDHHGHQAGDQALIDLAGLLQRHVRKDDRLFRYGGEEFVLLAPQTNPAGLETLAEKLLQAVRQSISSPAGQPVTVSIGVTSLHPGETVDVWFHRADSALYAAKNAGRDRVVMEADSADQAAAGSSASV